jgi:hypothetical protein
MKFSEIDWSILRGALILLVISVVIATVALNMSYSFWNQQDTALKRTNAKLLSARGQYHALDDEEDIIATYLPRYASLEEEGIIGREHRLDWIDVLRETARVVQVPRLEYAIEAQRQFDAGVDLNVGDYSAYASSMRVTLGLLHEGDLVRFLSGLMEKASGLVGVTGCEMTRAGEALISQPRASNVNAMCVLRFITIRGPESQPGASS